VIVRNVHYSVTAIKAAQTNLSLIMKNLKSRLIGEAFFYSQTIGDSLPRAQSRSNRAESQGQLSR
jgi:hypothetical protein